MAVLHFQQAVEEHLNWLENFKAALGGDFKALKAEEIIRDDVCTIGMWLHGEGEKFAHLKEFQRVKELHKKVHDVATRLWKARRQHEEACLDDLLNELDDVKHVMFLAWSDLNSLIGSLE